MQGTIICGVDGSESAMGAARVARELSARLGTRLTFVRVLDETTPDARRSVAAAELHDLVESLSCVRWLIELGHPADRLVDVAAREGASLIVVGSSGPRSSLLGSVSADVSRRAPCPVVVVAPGADHTLANGNGIGGGVGYGAGSAGPGAGRRDLAGGIARFGRASGS